MKQEYTLRIYKADKRLTKAPKYYRHDKIGQRCIGSYQFEGRDEAGMEREVNELKAFWRPKDGYSFEYFPTYKTVKNLMTGKDIQIDRDTPWCCNPASETYWSM